RLPDLSVCLQLPKRRRVAAIAVYIEHVRRRVVGVVQCAWKELPRGFTISALVARPHQGKGNQLLFSSRRDHDIQVASNVMSDSADCSSSINAPHECFDPTAIMTVVETARQSNSILLGHDNKVSASVVITMPNGDQVWSKNSRSGA